MVNLLSLIGFGGRSSKRKNRRKSRERQIADRFMHRPTYKHTDFLDKLWDSYLGDRDLPPEDVEKKDAPGPVENIIRDGKSPLYKYIVAAMDGWDVATKRIYLKAYMGMDFSMVDKLTQFIPSEYRGDLDEIQDALAEVIAEQFNVDLYGDSHSRVYPQGYIDSSDPVSYYNRYYHPSAWTDVKWDPRDSRKWEGLGKGIVVKKNSTGSVHEAWPIADLKKWMRQDVQHSQTDWARWIVRIEGTLIGNLDMAYSDEDFKSDFTQIPEDQAESALAEYRDKEDARPGVPYDPYIEGPLQKGWVPTAVSEDPGDAGMSDMKTEDKSKDEESIYPWGYTQEYYRKFIPDGDWE